MQNTPMVFRPDIRGDLRVRTHRVWIRTLTLRYWDDEHSNLRELIRWTEFESMTNGVRRVMRDSVWIGVR